MPRTSAVTARRRVAGITVGLLFVFMATVYPPLHAQLERLTGAAAVENGHSSDCERIHNDLTCVANGAVRALAGEGTPRVQSSTPLLATALPLATSRTSGPPCSGPTLDRGPPTA